MNNEEVAFKLARVGQWLVPAVIIAVWCFALQQRGSDYTWVVFIQAGIGTLILVPCWIIARAQVKAQGPENRNG